MSTTDVLAVDDVTSAAALFRHTAEQLEPVQVLLAMHGNGPSDLTSVVRACEEYDRRLRLLAWACQDRDSIIEREAGKVWNRALGELGGATRAITRSAPWLVDAIGIGLDMVPLVQAFEVAELMFPGHARVRDEGLDPAAVANTPPRSLTGIVDELVLRDQAKHGQIDVRFVQRPDGSRSVIVDIPGLATMRPNPSFATHDVANLGTCTAARDGANTAYEQGVIKAMKQAGVTKTDRVMLVGHSLGGMIAVNATRTLHKQGYDVTHVLTLGAPIGRTVGRLPDSVRVLAIENRGDPVPELDGVPNPRRRNQATVLIDRPGMHESEPVYQPGVAGLDRAGDPAVSDFERSAHAFLDGTSVTTHRYTVTKTLI
jgi:hypothetical protein